MTKKQMAQWQRESVLQAYKELENEIQIQWSGYVATEAVKHN